MEYKEEFPVCLIFILFVYFPCRIYSVQIYVKKVLRLYNRIHFSMKNEGKKKKKIIQKNREKKKDYLYRTSNLRFRTLAIT